MKNIMTVDVEDWYHSNDFNFKIDTYSNFESRVVESTGVLLDLFERYNVKATFFVLGCVAQKNADLVKRIVQNGHEIGSHGGWHQMVCHQTREEFRETLRFSKHILEDITCKEVSLFRAPSWSISKECLWALEILEEEGFKYDSSIQPFKTPLSGINGAPKMPYYPIVNGRKLNLLEVPPTVFSIGKFCFPFAGGFYLRFFPITAVSWALKKVNKERPGLVYLHPWEADVEQPKLKVPIHVKLSHYYRLESYVQKVEFLLKHFEFGPMIEIIREVHCPVCPII